MEPVMEGTNQGDDVGGYLSLTLQSICWEQEIVLLSLFCVMYDEKNPFIINVLATQVIRDKSEKISCLSLWSPRKSL
jgi:hypothetical protein